MFQARKERVRVHVNDQAVTHKSRYEPGKIPLDTQTERATGAPK
jgi:hypothetical protein